MHAVCVGTMLEPGLAQPLHGLNTSVHLRFQHRAGPLSSAPQWGLQAVSFRAAARHETNVHLWQKTSGDKTVDSGLLCHSGCRTSWAGKGQGLWRAAPHSACSCTTLCCTGAAGRQVTKAHRPDNAKRPWPRDDSGGGGVGPVGHISQAALTLFKKKL